LLTILASLVSLNNELTDPFVLIHLFLRESGKQLPSLLRVRNSRMAGAANVID
jgi:hypothetical protein